jgi:dTDP-4-amino-4,6-dideoxygalactose transaminase
LASVERVRPLAQLPGSVFHLFVVELDPSIDRQQLQEDLKRAGVATGIHYPVPLSRQGALESLHAKTPVAEEAAERILSLPIGPTITTDDVAYVSQCLKEALAS